MDPIRPVILNNTGSRAFAPVFSVWTALTPYIPD